MMLKNSIIMSLILLFMLNFLLIVSVHAKNLGVIGETYPIIEEDLLEFIQKKIQTMQQNGEWNKLQNQWKEKAKSHANRPTPLNITKTKKPKEWLFDPSIVLSKDLTDHQGRIFARRDNTFNPLSMVSLKTPLLFIDGDDKEQIKWAKNKIEKIKISTKIILINGSIANTEKIFKQPIYFDQAGRLTKHFQIEHVPAMLVQHGMQLQIKEELP